MKVCRECLSVGVAVNQAFDDQEVAFLLAASAGKFSQLATAPKELLDKQPPDAVEKAASAIKKLLLSCSEPLRLEHMKIMREKLNLEIFISDCDVSKEDEVLQ